MKICAVICEYNPFHTGHAYQLTKALRRYDAVVCVMSGNFVQRAEPAIAEKYVRAEIALRNGAAMVVENPFVYATANGEKFACGAVKTLKNLGQIDALVAGCETDAPELINIVADIRYEESVNFGSVLKARLDEGNSYAVSLTEATVFEAVSRGADEKKVRELLSSPNNLLCIEYVNAIRREKLNIKTEFIRRVGDGYNEKTVRGDYASASAIRRMISDEDFTAATPYLADQAETLIEEIKTHGLDERLFSDLALYAVKRATAEEISRAPDCREGIDKKIFEAARTATDLTELLASVKSKRYTLSRIRRIILQILFGVTTDFVNECDRHELPARVLAIREDFKPMLAYCKNTVLRTSDLSSFNSVFYERYFEVERKAAALYAQITRNKTDLFYPQKLITI